MITMLNVDCMEYMASLPDKAFDIAIVDPEYGIDAGNMTMGRGSRNDTGKNVAKNWDKKIPSKEYFIELSRVSKNQIIWGGNYFLDFLNATRCFLIWDKLDYNSDFAAAELAWTSLDKNVKIFKQARNVGNPKDKIHPTQKPKALYHWIIRNYCQKGWNILDTHGGSFSSAIVAEKMGFDMTICEIDKDYFDAGVKRFEKETDLGLFAEAPKYIQTSLI